MKLIKKICLALLAVLCFISIIPIYSTITDKSEKKFVKVGSFAKTVFVEKDKATLYYYVPGGASYLFLKDGKVLKKSVFVPVRRPTLFVTLNASDDETAAYRQIFVKS